MCQFYPTPYNIPVPGVPEVQAPSWEWLQHWPKKAQRLPKLTGHCCNLLQQLTVIPRGPVTWTEPILFLANMEASRLAHMKQIGAVFGVSLIELGRCGFCVRKECWNTPGIRWSHCQFWWRWSLCRDPKYPQVMGVIIIDLTFWDILNIFCVTCPDASTDIDCCVLQPAQRACDISLSAPLGALVYIPVETCRLTYTDHGDIRDSSRWFASTEVFIQDSEQYLQLFALDLSFHDSARHHPIWTPWSTPCKIDESPARRPFLRLQNLIPQLPFLRLQCVNLIKSVQLVSSYARKIEKCC